MSPRHGKDGEPGLIARLRAQLAQAEAERDKLQRHLDARAELDAMLMAGTLPVAADGTGPLPAVPGHRRQPAHARTPREARWLRVVRDTAQGVIPVGAAAAAFRLGHAARTAPVMVKAGAAVAFTVTTAAVVTPSSPVSPFGAATTRVPAPAASVYDATPVSLPARLPAAAFVTKPGMSAVSSTPLTTPGPVPPHAATAHPPHPPQDPQPPAQQQDPAGTLQVDTATADLTSGQAATVQLTASGGAVTWHAWCAGPDALIGDADGTGLGTVDPGNPVDLTISLAPVQDGRPSATCHVWPGDHVVTVTLPAPAPSQADTPAPDPSAT